MCGNSYKSDYYRKIHQQTHGDDCPNVCRWCNKKFSLKQALINHERLHTGERPFGCGDCDKKFINKQQLRRHRHIMDHNLPPIIKFDSDNKEKQITSNTSIHCTTQDMQIQQMKGDPCLKVTTTASENQDPLKPPNFFDKVKNEKSHS